MDPFCYLLFYLKNSRFAFTTTCSFPSFCWSWVTSYSYSSGFNHFMPNWWFSLRLCSTLVSLQCFLQVSNIGYSSIYPSIHPLLIQLMGICWSLSQLSYGERQGYTLDRFGCSWFLFLFLCRWHCWSLLKFSPLLCSCVLLFLNPCPSLPCWVSLGFPLWSSLAKASQNHFALLS